MRGFGGLTELSQAWAQTVVPETRSAILVKEKGAAVLKEE